MNIKDPTRVRWLKIIYNNNKFSIKEKLKKAKKSGVGGLFGKKFIKHFSVKFYSQTKKFNGLIFKPIIFYKWIW